MTDMFGNYKSQETRALQSINSSKYPDTNVDLERNLQRLNSFVDYIAQYLQVMQKGVDQANQDVFQRTRDVLQNMGVLLAGGAIFDNDFGDLQYFLPAIGALLGFDSDTPFPLNLFHAAEHFFLGYVVPLDSFRAAMIDQVNLWADRLNLNEEFMTELNDWLDAVGGLNASFRELMQNIFDMFDIFGVNQDGMGPLAELWQAITKLFGGFDLGVIGDITDPLLSRLAPWIHRMADNVEKLTAIINAWSDGAEKLEGIINFSKLFEGIDWANPNFTPGGALQEWMNNKLVPTNIFAHRVEFNTVSDRASLAKERADESLANFATALSKFGFTQVATWLDDLLVTRGAASTAITNAATAQAKANLAEALATVGVLRAKFGSNLLYSPNFEDTTIPRNSYNNTLSLSSYTYSTDQKHSGTQSLKIIYDSTAVTAAAQGMELRVEPSQQYLPTQPESWYWVEGWFYLHSTHSANGRLKIFAEAKDSLGVNVTQQGFIFDQAINSLTKSTWTKFAGHIQIPTGRDQFVLVAQRTGCSLNDVIYFDDLVMREVTEAKLANTLANAAQNAAENARAKAQEALDNFVAILNKFGLTRVADWIDDIFATRGNANTATVNASTALANFSTATTKFGTPTVAAWVDDLYGTKGVAAAASSNANTGISNAATAQATANTAQNAAATADGKAVTAQNLIEQSAKAGLNLIPDPSFEDSAFDTGRLNTSYVTNGGTAPYVWSHATDRPRTGTRSLKVVAAGSYCQIILTPTLKSNGYIPVKPGQVFYFSCWAYAASTNTGTNRIENYLELSTTAPGSGINYTVFSGPANLTNGVWTKVSGYATVPDNGSKWMRMYACGVHTGVVSGDTFWFDDVELYDVTEAYNAQVTANTGVANAATAQSTANTANTAAATADGKAVAINTALFNQSTPGTAILGTAVPAIDGSKINTGTLAEDRIASLSAGKISSGTFADARIPNLATSKITSGTFGSSFIADTAITTAKLADLAVTGVKTSGLDGSKITGGTISEGVIGALSAGKITSGTFGSSFIANLAITNAKLADLAVTGDKTSGLDASKITGGVLGTGVIPNITKGMSTDLQSTVDNLTNAFTGNNALTGMALGDALEAMKNAFNTLGVHTNQINQLKAQKEQAATGTGMTLAENFGDHANQTGLPNFTITYSGAGTSSIGISDGVACWINTNNADRDAKIIHNTPTNTDFQVLRGTMTTPTESAVGGGTPKFHAIGRVSSDGNSFVWARAYSTGSWMQFRGEIGCTVNGVETIWANNIPLTWNLSMTFYLGVGTNARQYQVYSGNTLVYSHTESGTTSQLGANNRKWGAIAQIRSGTFGPRTSGKLGGCSVADNPQPSYNGAYAQISRTSGSAITFPGNDSTISNTFWTTVAEDSSDPVIDADAANSTFTVFAARVYVVSACIRTAATGLAYGSLVLQRSTNGGSTWTASEQMGPSTKIESGGAVGGTFVIYLNANDKIRIITRSTAGTGVGSCMTTGSYVTVTAAG